MAVNQTKIFDQLEETVLSLNPNEFIYQFLTAFNFPKATITQVRQGSSRNVAKAEGHIALKNKIYFAPSYSDDDLDVLLEERLVDPSITKNKIRFVIVTDFSRFLAWDTLTRERLDINLDELHSHYAFFLPLVGLEKAITSNENPADVKAAEKMGKLFDLIRVNNDLKKQEDIHALNVFLTRLLFCFFAEDTGIFEETQFTSAIKSYTDESGNDLDEFLYKLFTILNTPDGDEKRDKLPKHISAFRYVNGGLFASDEPIPSLGKKGRRILLECGTMDWSEINPDIFGSMFQAVIDVEQRSRLGQHYTSYSNIMKVIQPLFLDPLRTELEKHKNNVKGLKQLLVRLGKIKVFDPACGSGNFLIIAYKELRQLEMEVLLALVAVEPQSIVMSGLHLSQFYGIEIDDFACEVARLSLWLVEHQVNNQWKQLFGDAPSALPLKESGHIWHGNSLRVDWNTICPKKPEDEVYVIGNPPFLGTTGRSSEQRDDMLVTFDGFKSLGYLDYVSCWFWKGANYISFSKAELALVATNSICQGEQVATLWPHIFRLGLHIHFAYPTFSWENNARDKAAVHVVIIGLSQNSTNHRLYQKVGKQWHNITVENISPYLIEGSNTVVTPLNRPFMKGIPQLLFGNKPTDGGHFFLERNELNELLRIEPRAECWIRKVLGASEFLNGKERWCLWLVDATETDLKSMPFVSKRLNEIRKLRIKSGHTAALKMAEKPHLFMQISQPKSGEYILIPSVSSERRTYVPMGFFGCDVISTNLNYIIPNGTLYEFGILNSLMHNDWMRLVAGRLKSDYRYSSSVVYNPFPWPKVDESQRSLIENLAEEILLTRAGHPGKTLAELYDPDKMPEDLHRTHQVLDRAVERLYRDRPFKDTEDRLSFLLSRYESMASK